MISVLAMRHQNAKQMITKEQTKKKDILYSISTLNPSKSCCGLHQTHSRVSLFISNGVCKHRMAQIVTFASRHMMIVRKLIQHDKYLV